MTCLRQAETLRMNQTLLVVSRCWEQAEEQIQSEIANFCPGADEELITQLFYMRFAARLQDASADRLIAESFLKDLLAYFSYSWGYSSFRLLAQGLVANVTLHERQTEKQSGGDLGLVIVRPTVSRAGNWIQVGHCRRGLLVQAKLQHVDGRWGRFTPRQQKVLPDRLSYLALLLYSYQDTAVSWLRPFEWQVCRGASFEDVKGWLRRGTFPSSVRATTVIQGLGTGDLGTGDPKVLDEVVAPAGNRVLLIRIDWPDDKRPSSKVRVHSAQAVGTQGEVRVRV